MFWCLIFSILTYAQTDTDEIVRRGEYLTRAADCIACHTAEEGQFMAGGRKIDTPFGPLYSPNLTPHSTGLGKWTSDDFYRAVHSGIGINGENLYPVFPYDFYTLMPREDVDAIYAYLRTIPPVANTISVNHLRFPFNIRQSLLLWRTLYFEEGTFKPNPNKSSTWNRGAYLVEGPGHCQACHTPRNALGGLKKDKAYTGAQIENWFAPNITTNPFYGIGELSFDELFTFLKSGVVDEKIVALGPMTEVIQHSLSFLTDDDLRAITIYLRSLSPKPEITTSGPAGQEGSEDRREKILFLENCAGCHHPRGTGRRKIAPPIAGNPIVRADTAANLLNVVLFGIPEQYNYEAMPSFADKLSDKQIAMIINYVRRRWGAPDNTVSEDQVREWRMKGTPQQ